MPMPINVMPAIINRNQRLTCSPGMSQSRVSRFSRVLFLVLLVGLVIVSCDEKGSERSDPEDYNDFCRPYGAGVVSRFDRP